MMIKPIEEHDDDKPIGRLLSRREMLLVLGGASAAAFLAACTPEQLAALPTAIIESTAEATALVDNSVLPSCVVRPALTEGPYFVDVALNRSDIRVEPSDGSIKEGLPLVLRFRVSNISDTSCAPLAGAQVDIWHCDAAGAYSAVSDPGFDTSDQKWLRGYQITDEKGIAEFMTIYPGWYSGRTVHIHFKIRTEPEAESGYEFTSQLFFDERISDSVFALEPYAAKGQRDRFNTEDNIFQGSEGLLTLALETVEEGYTATFDIGLDLSQPASESGEGRGGNPPQGTPPPRP
jgi:protocatechuate 3,4-dioxygenase beta subunit